jgi:hypothetical protein
LTQPKPIAGIVRNAVSVALRAESAISNTSKTMHPREIAEKFHAHHKIDRLSRI